MIHAGRTPLQLRQFAIDAFGLVKIAEDDGDGLYVPVATQATGIDEPPPY